MGMKRGITDMEYEIYTTDKYKCCKCKLKKMYPNAIEGKVMGYICTFCGAINYPIRDKLENELMEGKNEIRRNGRRL